MRWMHSVGMESRTARRNDRPYLEPACAWVAIPEGSSSDAPVIRPGPMARRYWRHFAPDSEGSTLDSPALVIALEL
jgi:hypothetical protein